MRFFTTGILKLLQSTVGRDKRPLKKSEKRGYRPLAEVLEDRRVLSISFTQTPLTQTNFDGATITVAMDIQAIAQDTTAGQTISYSEIGLPTGLNIDPSTGIISGTISTTADLGSPYTATITASDAASGSTMTQLQWNIQADPIGFTNPGTQTSADNGSVSLSAAASNTQGNALIYTAIGLPPNLTIDSASGLISGQLTSTADQSSPYGVTITATDPTANASNSESFQWDVTTPPTISFPTVPSTQTNFDGATITTAMDIQVIAQDSIPGQTISYSASGLPAGLNIDPSTGIISGTISTTADSSSPYTVTITANDSASSPAMTTFQWNVQADPIGFTNPGTQSSSDNAAVNLFATASNSQGNALTYSAIGLPPNLTINSVSGEITGQLSATANSGSPYTVTVTATDPVANASNSETFQWDVTTAPTIVFQTIPGAQTNFDGATVGSVPVVAQETTVIGEEIVYSAQNLPPGLSISSSTGVISGVVSDTADTGNPYDVVITATDQISSPATADFQWTVNADPISFPTALPTQTNFDGATVDISAAATDTQGTPQTNPLTYTASGLPAGLTISSTTGAITGQISTTADTQSPYTVTVVATDPLANASNSETFQWDVTTPPITLTAPAAQTNDDGATVSLQVVATDTNTPPNALTYSASNLPPGLSMNSSSGKITGQISDTADTGSPYTVTVTATDATANAATSQTFIWTVDADTVSVTAPANQNGTGLEKVALQISASDTASNTLTYSATGLPSGLTINSKTGLISGTIAENANSGSPYTVTVTATDTTANASNSATFTWTVSPGPINGVVFFDANGNGKLDASDTRMPGVSVLLVGNATISVNVTNVSNGIDPVITTATPNNLSVGNKVTIAGVGGATGVNGTFTVASILSNTEFTITTTTAPGTYTSGGTVTTTSPISVTCVTDANGNFSFANPPAGTYTIHAASTAALKGAVPSIADLVTSPTINVTNLSVAVPRTTKAGLSATSISINEFLTSTILLDQPFGPVGSGQAAVNHAPTVSSTISAVTLSSTTTTSTVDLAGHFTDPDLANSDVTLNMTNGLTQVAIKNVTNAINPTITTTTADELAVGDSVTIGGVVGATGVNGTFTVASTPTATSFTITDGTKPGVYKSGGTFTTSITISNVTDTVDPTITTAEAHHLAVGDTIYISGVVGATGVNGLDVITAINSATSFTIATAAAPGTYTSGGTVSNVQMEDLDLTLFDAIAPQTVANFYDYIKSGEYNNSIFTRLVKGFVLQGGGATINTTGTTVSSIAVGPTVPNEFKTPNTIDTIAMAQSGSNPDSATDQFFINVANNSTGSKVNDLDTSKFTVFGKVNSNSLAALSALETTNTFNASSSAAATGNSTVDLQNLPLSQYTDGSGGNTASTFPADANPSNYMTIQSVTINKQPDFLTYSVSSSNTSIVTATLDPVHNEQLTLTAGSTTGTATITVTATDKYGLSVSTTFSVTVSS